MPTTPDFDASETIPYITSKNIKKGNINFNNIKYISEVSYKEILGNRPIIQDDILISMIGTLGEVAKVKESDLPFYGQNMYLLRLNQELINIDYFLHFFDSEPMKTYFSNIKNNSSQGYLKANHIEEIEIPLPDLEIQGKITDALNNFYKLNNDYNQGLPAEIEARRQQYEYYLNKLLTFKELKSA
jgi:type I restriction enzyme S subunit